MSTAATKTRLRRKQARPGEIVAAALASFAERGYAATKLEDVAAAAGISKGTIYLYFPTKEELFRDVVRQLVVPMIAEAEEGLVQGTATEQLTQYLAHQWQCLGREGSEWWVRLVLFELYQFPDLAQFFEENVVVRSNKVLGDIVRRGIASGEFRPIDPATAVSMIKAITLMHVLWVGPHSSSARLRSSPRDQVQRDITEFVVRALGPTAGAAGAGVEPE